MTSVRTAEREQRGQVSVERVAEPAPARIGGVDVEVDAESRAQRALEVQRDWQPDLRGVNVHTDGAAASEADRLGAAAFTRGNDVYLGSQVEAGTPEGDHVLAHELAHVQQQNGPDEVHRFPATALGAGPVDWGRYTGSVVRPSGGVSGGVYIMKSKAPLGGIATVVAKPIFGASGLGTKESGESLAFGDAALKSLLGINTPTSRVIKKGSPEFGQLVSVCTPHQPKKPEGEEGADWKPLSAAESFLIMGEVPGKSVASLADKAATGDKDAMSSLYRSVLDDYFVEEMGRVSVGDLLIGNNDRMIGGAMNLGNIMVQMENGRSKLWAIDTNAVLGAKFDVAKVVDNASASTSLHGGFENAKNDLKAGGAAVRIEGFFQILIDRMKGGAPPKAPDQDGPTPVEMFEWAYEQRKAALIRSFEFGWDSALIDIFALVNTKAGRSKMKDLTDKAKGTESEQDLDYTALKINASYLASKAEGKDEKEASADLGSLAAAKQLSGFDPKAVAIPVDKYHWNAAPLPGGEAFSADLDQPASLPAPKAMVDVMKVRNRTYDPAALDKLGTAVDNAKVELAALGNKSRGIVKKKELPRNRTLAGTFVASSYLVGGGAIRAVASAADLSTIVETVSVGLGGKLKPAQAAAMLPAARFAKTYTALLETNMDGFSKALKEEARGVARIKKYSEAAAVSDTLTKISTYVDENKTRHLGAVTKKDPQALVDALLTASKKTG